MEWARILACIAGTVDQELLFGTSIYWPKNRILKAQGGRGFPLPSARPLGEIRKALCEVATAATPDTILACCRKLVTRKFDGSRAGPITHRSGPRGPDRWHGQGNGSWGYDRIVGAPASLDYKVSGQTVGNVLRRHGIPAAPERERQTTSRAPTLLRWGPRVCED
jgi:putative transposase